MNRMIYQVAVGEQMKSGLYAHCIESVAKYCERHGIKHIVQRQPILRIAPDIFASNRSEESWKKHGGYLPIYEKENAFNHLDEYDQIAIIDADIYIREDAPNIFDAFGTEHAFGACVERDMPIHGQYAMKIQNYSHMQYTRLNDVQWDWRDWGAKFYNMGMMVLNSQKFKPYLKGQDAKSFLMRMEFKRFIDGEGAWKWSTDQTLLNWFVKKYDVPTHDMEWKWNALYSAVKDEYIPDAYFIHFFLKDKLPNKGEDVAALMKKIGAE